MGGSRGPTPFHDLLAQLAAEHERLQSRCRDLEALLSTAARLPRPPDPGAASAVVLARGPRRSQMETVNMRALPRVAPPSSHWIAPPALVPEPGRVHEAEASQLPAKWPSPSPVRAVPGRVSWAPADGGNGEAPPDAFTVSEEEEEEMDFDPPSPAIIAAWERMTRGIQEVRGTVKYGLRMEDIWNKLKSRLGEAPMLAQLEVWPEWKAHSSANHHLNADSRSSMGLTTSAGTVMVTNGVQFSLVKEQHTGQFVSVSGEHGLRAGDRRMDRTCMQRFIVQPNSRRKIAWDLMSALVLGCDVMRIPLMAFDLPNTVFSNVLDVGITVFWSLDMALSFLSGFYDKGVIEMRPWSIAKRYVTSFFFIDATCITVDWIVIFVDAASETVGLISLARLAKTIRILRIMRMLRIVRATRVTELFEILADNTHSETVLTAMEIVKMLMGIALLSHFVACAWYAVGTDSWVLTMEADFKGPGELDNTYRYFTSLHWAMCQYGTSSMEIIAGCTKERVYAIVTIFVALFVFSSLVSAITSSMSHLQSVQEEQNRVRRNVRRFITDSRLSLDLGNQILSFVRAHRPPNRRVHEQDIELLKFLNEQVKMHMRAEMYLPVLLTHPFFMRYHLADTTGLIRVCHSALTSRSVAVGEEAFTFGVECLCMYFLVAGRMEYFNATMNAEECVVLMGEGARVPRVCEIALWTRWTHHGRLVATEMSDLVSLSSTKFRYISQRRNPVRGPCYIYAREYSQHFLRTAKGIKFLSDVWQDEATLLKICRAAFQDTNELELPHQGAAQGVGTRISMNARRSLWRRSSSALKLVTGLSQGAFRRLRPF